MWPIVRDVIVTVGGVAALLWAIYKYKKQREAEAVLQIEVAVEVHPVGSLTKILDIAIQVTNVGKAAAFTETSQLDSCTCAVRTIPCPDLSCEIRWDGAQTKDLVAPIKYMSDWADYYPEYPMIFEPGSTEIFHRVVTTEYKGPLWVRAAIVDKDENLWRGDRIVVIP